jgi:GTP-binding protein EngB required for normal cell division
MLNESQARRILSAFVYIDQLLREVARLAHAQGTMHSELAPEQLDLSSTEGRLVGSLVETARRRMLATMHVLGLPRPKADVSARWSVITSLRFVDISLSELTAESLGGYGALDEESAAMVTAVASELRELVARGLALLQPREGEQLRDRLAVLPGPLGDILRAAEELSTRHGLVEARQLIAAAADRAAASTIDIGIFGRVSSGKSSLINALVGGALLPVGSTPVTAVPLRLVHGDEAIVVYFADGRAQSIDPGELAAYATEEGNRENVRGVASILIQTPALADGVALLDTPGVGSLSQSGPAQAFAWLPRCDLGIVLVAAGTPLGREELALVNGLTDAGIEVEVLLSKSDLLPESERAAAIEYVRREIVRATSAAGVLVRPVSVLASSRQLLEAWRDEQLTPMVAARREVARAARARRLRALLGALGAAMRERPALDRSTIEFHRTRSEAEREIAETAGDLASSAPAALASAIDGVAHAWKTGADARDAARQPLLAVASRSLARVRSSADRVLDVSGHQGGDEAAGRIPPLFDPAFLDALPVPASPGVMDRAFPRARARQRMAEVASPLDDAYDTYSRRIRAWGRERLEENVARATALRLTPTAASILELRPLESMIEAHFPYRDT